MTWHKGQSGNPRGKGARDKVPYARVLHVLKKLGGQNGEVWAGELHVIAMDRSIEVNARIKALSILVPYLWGRPVDQLEVSGSVGGAVRVVHEYHDPIKGVVEANRLDQLRLMGGPAAVAEAIVEERIIEREPAREKAVGEDERED